MAWNDPQWGKKNDGPPDLDKIWRDVNAKISKMLGRKPRLPGNPGNPAKKVSIIVAIVVALWIASGVYSVGPGERGIVLVLGKYAGTALPGVGWHLPYPIASVETVNVDDIHTTTIGYRESTDNKIPKESLMLTADNAMVDLQFSVQYTIKDPEAWLFNDRSPDEAVRQASESVMNTLVGKSTLNDILYGNHDSLAAHATQRLQELVDYYGTGVSISKVALQSVQAPPDAQPVFDDTAKILQDNEKLKQTAQAYAGTVIPEAKGIAAKLQTEAEAYQQTTIATATGDAERFEKILDQYHKAPQVTRERLYLDTMQHILSNATTIVTDGSKTGGRQTFYLPLDKLMSLPNTPVGKTPSTPLPPPAPAGVAPVTDAVPVVIKPISADVPQTDTSQTEAPQTVNTREEARVDMHSRDREDRP